MRSWYSVRFPMYFNLIHLCESIRQEGRKILNLKKKTGVITDSLWVRYTLKSRKHNVSQSDDKNFKCRYAASGQCQSRPCSA